MSAVVAGFAGGASASTVRGVDPAQPAMAHTQAAARRSGSAARARWPGKSDLRKVMKDCRG
jgi:hypothetical protein